MAIVAPQPTSAAPAARLGSAVLTGGCDGYPAGTTGVVAGWRQGCAVFVPDRPAAVARWARPRSSLYVPPTLLAVWR